MRRQERHWEGPQIRATCERLRQSQFSGDLSGFPFGECARISGYKITDSNLTSASFANSAIRECHFERDDFTKADLREIADHGNEFLECLFGRANFRGSTIGFNGSRFGACKFEHASFVGTGFVRPVFEGCSFVRCTLRNVDFEASSFLRCTFVGELRDVWFRDGFSHPTLAAEFGKPGPNRMQEVDFSQATFWGVTFGGGVDLSTVIPPMDGEHHLYDRWRSRFANVQLRASRLPAEVQAGVRKFIYAFEPSSATQDSYIVNAADLRQMFGDQSARTILDLLGSSVRYGK